MDYHSLTKKLAWMPLVSLSIVLSKSSLAFDPDPEWRVNERCFRNGTSGTFDDIAVKDPSIVYHGGKYHLFYTARDGHNDPVTQNPDFTTGYASADTLEGLDAADRFRLENLNPGDNYYCAPQVFYFEPQNRWYLVFQILKDGQRYQPMFSTTSDIADPDSWEPPEELFGKDDQKKWIDFWVIADDTYVYCFFTRPGNKELVYRRTRLADFPDGWDTQSTVAYTNTDIGFEGGHIYRSKCDGRYYAQVEYGDRDHPRWFSLLRSNSLSGPWIVVDDEWATEDDLDANEWTSMVSHGEAIRAGYDQRMEIECIDHVDYLIQGVTTDLYEDHYYWDIPWDLGTISNYGDISGCFRDNFDNGDANGWTEYGGTWSVSNGKYRLTSSDRGLKSVFLDTHFTDFMYEADVTVNSEAYDAGLIFRVSSPAVGCDSYRGYYAGIDGDNKVVLGKASDGNWSELASTSMIISSGVSYHMKVVASGADIKVYVNDMITPKITTNDSTWTSGAVGVRAHRTTAVFDNLFVAALPAFKDDFDDGNANGWTTYDGTWVVENHTYKLSTAGRGYKSIASGRTLHNFTYETDIKVSAASNAGIVFRVTDPGVGCDVYKGYYAGISDSGDYIILGKADGDWTEIARAGAAIDADTWYNLKVVTVGSVITVYLNGRAMISADDTTWSSGYIGVRGHNASNTYWDNIVVVE